MGKLLSRIIHAHASGSTHISMAAFDAPRSRGSNGIPQGALTPLKEPEPFSTSCCSRLHVSILSFIHSFMEHIPASHDAISFTPRSEWIGSRSGASNVRKLWLCLVWSGNRNNPRPIFPRLLPSTGMFRKRDPTKSGTPGSNRNQSRCGWNQCPSLRSAL